MFTSWGKGIFGIFGQDPQGMAVNASMDVNNVRAFSYPPSRSLPQTYSPTHSSVSI